MDALNAPVKLLVVVQEEKTESHELEYLKKGKEKAKEIGEKGSKERHFYTIKLVHDLKSTARDQEEIALKVQAKFCGDKPTLTYLLTNGWIAVDPLQMLILQSCYCRPGFVW